MSTQSPDHKQSDDDDRHPTVGETFETEQTSKGLLQLMLPAAWIKRKLQPDFYLDYLVELTHNGELTGIQFGIQLKGWRGKPGADLPTHNLKTKHLLYYHEKCLFPVFLILIDVNKKRGFWAFMQEFASQADLTRLRKQEKVTIKFSAENMLDDRVRFENAILAASKFLRDLHPGSIKAALFKEKQRIETSDPRVQADVNFVNGATHVTIHPKQDVKISLQFDTSNPETLQKVKDFVEKGADLKLKGKELKLIGLPAFPHFDADPNAELVLSHKHEREGHVIFSWDESQPMQQLHMPGTFTAGIKYVCFRGALPQAPLQFSAELGGLQTMGKQAFDTQLELRPEVWEGKKLLLLPYFDSLLLMFRSLHAAKQLSLRFFIEGNLALAGNIADTDVAWFLDLLEILHKARIVSRRYNLDPTVPALKNISDDDIKAIEELHSLSFEPGVPIDIPNATLSMTTFQPGTPDAPTKVCAGSGRLMIVQENPRYKIFDEVVETESVRRIFTEMIVVDSEPLKDGIHVKMTFKGSPTSKQMLEFGSRPLNVAE